jgi:undecaprenyl phosphate N,N'-diacetylbacillosamine 1-phosphate transferase
MQNAANNSTQYHQEFLPSEIIWGIRQPLGLYVQLVKPCMDILFAILFAILSFPIFVTAVILIKLDSTGPVLFKQQRYGKNGRLFWINKFRTMYANVPNQGRSPDSDEDARITRVGRFLRKSSLDEIPQLLNILKGEMSFIGPRPEQKSIVEAVYTDYEKQRFLIKPGITGLWQISKDRLKPIHEHLEHDFMYIRKPSLLIDIKVLLKTFVIMFKSNTY